MYLPMVGISSTCDWTWRPNSRSTFSRSARIGSKICDSADEVFSTGFSGRTLSRPEERVEVRGGARGHVVPCQPVEVGQGLDDASDIRRLVALAAMRHRRQKRTVGFCQQPIDRNPAHRFTEIGGARK